MSGDTERTEKIKHLLAEVNRGGVRDRDVLLALARIPREAFLSPKYRPQAWENRALPIEQEQTISQPQIVGLMTQAACLSGEENVLEIGTGSGYQAAVLASLARHVVTIERFETLAERARERLAELNVTNVDVHVGDGTSGWAAQAPYDRIIVTAAAPHLPQAFTDQLAQRDGARIVIPIGSATDQDLFVFERQRDELRRTSLGPVRFVPLIGESGWNLPEDE